MTLLSVPMPGFWRRGIQSSKTTAPEAMTTLPKLQPVLLERP
jgi:hypothetical protein